MLLAKHAVGENNSIKSPFAMKAHTVEYDSKEDSILAEGNIFIVMDNYTLQADRVYYDLKKDLIFAEGNIRIKDAEGKIIIGERAIFKDKLKRGLIAEFILKFEDNTILAARLANRLSRNRVSLYKATFTPCMINCGKSPMWQISARDTDIDYEKQKITYHHMFFEVYGLPVVYFPYFFHPTPSAPAQSGFLTPGLKQNNIMLPVYYRAKSNLDVTLSPRFSKKYTIFELEFRHKLKDGEYKILGSFGDPPYKHSKSLKDFKSERYHIFVKGDFNKNDINYGFDINRTSDKAYLRNYHEIYASYLESKIYVNTVNNRDYFSLESFSFQELRKKDYNKDMPLVLPSIRTQNVLSLNDDESLLLNIRNNTVTYNERSGKQLARSALDLALSSNMVSNNGHLVTLTLSNRADLYLVSLSPPYNKQDKESIWYRNIPEVQTKWRYPLVKPLSSTLSMKIEPVIMVVVGRNYESRFSKFTLIDASKNELSEQNIFNSSRFSGIDYHEYGKRLSYGINSSLLSDLFYLDLFLGQLFYQNNIIKNGSSEYVGNATLDINNNVELFYKFRKNQQFKAIRDEVGVSTNVGKITASSTFTKINNIARYYAGDGFEFPENKASQLSFNLGYQIVPNWWVGSEARLDVTKREARILQRTIQVTYTKDCVSISGKFYDDYTHDSTRRGVRKFSTKTVSIGLKVLNM